MLLTIIGLIASFTSIMSLPPQLYQTYKTKSADDVSMLMLVNFLICSLSWVAYGFLTDTFSVWSTNIVMTFFSVVMIAMKIRYSSI